MSVTLLRKEPAEPSLTGKARCIGCGHKWVAVTPVGRISDLECPACFASKGVILGTCEPEHELFVCYCGCDLFRIARNGMLCANCGVWADGF